MIHIPHLETDVTQACQLSCVGCNHSVPLWRKHGPWQADPNEVFEDLSHLAKFLHTPRWGALGGEPLLHRRLVPILEAARASHIADRLEVWTNGLLLPRMKEEFWRAFDVLVLSVYPGKHTQGSLDAIAKQCREAGVELELKGEAFQVSNFKSMLEETPTDEAATRSKFAGCFFRQFSRSASYGFFFTCCCGPHLPMLMQQRPFGSDGVRIADLDERGLNEYLHRSEPLGCCSICAGRDTAKPIGWREERDPERWISASQGVGA